MSHVAEAGMCDLIDIVWMDPKVCASASMITSAEPGTCMFVCMYVFGCTCVRLCV